MEIERTLRFYQAQLALRKVAFLDLSFDWFQDTFPEENIFEMCSFESICGYLSWKDLYNLLYCLCYTKHFYVSFTQRRNDYYDYIGKIQHQSKNVYLSYTIFKANIYLIKNQYIPSSYIRKT